MVKSSQLTRLFCLRADMHHVKSEHEKDEDDDLDDDRKPELGHHGHHSYYQHPMSMGGHYNHHHHHSLKTEIDTISKNQTGSDCGVPIPASKPKIWSLADTAACKTPPPHLHPNAGAWGYQTSHQQHPSQQYHTESPTLNHQQQQMHQHQSQSHLQQQQMPLQQQHMGMSMQQAANGADTVGMNMNMITSGHHNQSMSGMMNTFGGNSAYSRYGGFLTTDTHRIQQQAPAAGQHQYINHNHTGGSTTPVTPNSSTGQPTTPTLQQSQTSSNNQTNLGFPEVQTGKPNIASNKLNCVT